MQTKGNDKSVAWIANQGNIAINKPFKTKARPHMVSSSEALFVSVFMFVNLPKVLPFENSLIDVRASPYSYCVGIRACTYVGCRIFKIITTR